jgi:hypothetical protein
MKPWLLMTLPGLLPNLNSGLLYKLAEDLRFTVNQLMLRFPTRSEDFMEQLSKELIMALKDIPYRLYADDVYMLVERFLSQTHPSWPEDKQADGIELILVDSSREILLIINEEVSRQSSRNLRPKDRAFVESEVLDRLFVEGRELRDRYGLTFRQLVQFIARGQM